MPKSSNPRGVYSLLPTLGCATGVSVLSSTPREVSSGVHPHCNDQAEVVVGDFLHDEAKFKSNRTNETLHR